MKLFTSILLLLSICGYSTIAYSQDSKIDSLLSILKTTKEDTNRVNVLCQLSEESADDKDVMAYADEALQLAERLNYKKGIADASALIGFVLNHLGNFKSALEYDERSLKIRKETGDKEGVAEISINIAAVYASLGEMDKAMEYFQMSLKMQEQIGNKNTITKVLNNIGYVYQMQGDITNALEYYQQALKIAEEISSKEDIGLDLNNIGAIYLSENNYTKALEYLIRGLQARKEAGDKYGEANSLENVGTAYQKAGDIPKSMEYFQESLKLNEEIGNKKGVANSLNKIGKNYAELGDYPTALDYCKKSLEIREEIGNKKGIVISLTDISTILLKQKKPALAEPLCVRALDISLEIGYAEGIRDASEALSNIYGMLGKYKDAYLMHVEFKKMNDSISNVEIRKSTDRKQLQYEAERKDNQIKLLTAENNLKSVNAEKINQQKEFAFAGIVGVILLGGYGFYRYRQRKALENHQVMLGERLRISRELHDDIGSTLSSIAVYSEVARNRAIKNENETEVISKIGTASRDLIDKMNDIVWSLNPDNEGFEALETRMQHFAATMFAPRNISYNFTADPQIKNLQLKPDHRKNIFLIFKEAVHNIVKYAECKTVNIVLSEHDNSFTMIITDNGKGFDLNNHTSYNGNGIKNMRSRAKDINAQLDIDSRIGEGTKIELLLVP